MKASTLSLVVLFATLQGTVSNAGQDFLVKLKPGTLNSFRFMKTFSTGDQKVETLTDEWVHVKSSAASNVRFNNGLTLKQTLQSNEMVEYVQPNYKIKLLENYKVNNPYQRSLIAKALESSPSTDAQTDNPPIPNAPTNEKVGIDSDLNKQWGMNDIGGKEAWKIHKGNRSMIVAVLDTGTDYTHPDLVANLWRNPGETGVDTNGKDKSSNGVDDDNNGYADDIIGWDMARNDNKPYDVAVEQLKLIFGGGNPGHGTHCAGNVAARGNNSIGISGVAPNVQIMTLRFMDEKGSGTTDGAIKAIKYAVDNGAKVLSNSWGSEGEDPAEDASNQALKDIIQYAQDHGALFIAAAGNGHQGVGYDNDTDGKPGYPASYNHDIIVSVAALDSSNKFGSFSNWGVRSVDLGAPGVKIYSTVVGGGYSDKVVDLPMLGIEVFWDGTSMATPHVSGAAALYWSAYPEKTWQEVKAALLNNTVAVPELQGKLVTGGKLNVLKMLEAK